MENETSIELTSGGEWIRIGSFLARRGLVTHVWARHIASRTSWLKRDKAETVPCDLWEVNAAVKNTGLHYWCATLDTEAAANEFLKAACHLLALAPSKARPRHVVDSHAQPKDKP